MGMNVDEIAASIESRSTDDNKRSCVYFYLLAEDYYILQSE